MNKTNNVEIENSSEEDRERAILSQARLVSQFMQTELWQLFKNTWDINKELNDIDMERCLKTQSARELVIYHTGKRMGLEAARKGIEKIVSDGNAIEAKKKLLNEREEM